MVQLIRIEFRLISISMTITLDDAGRERRRCVAAARANATTMMTMIMHGSYCSSGCLTSGESSRRAALSLAAASKPLP